MKKYILNKEIISYLIVGILTTIISISTYFLFSHFILTSKSTLIVEINNIISWTAAVFFAYIANIKYVFKTNGNIIKFISSRIFTLLIEMILMYILIVIIDDFISKIITQFIVIVLNYILSKKIVFKKA